MVYHSHISRALTLVFLLALVAGGLTTVTPAPRAEAQVPAVPAGWVLAQVVSGGCDAYGNCNSSVTPGSANLYEYKPDRETVGRNFSVNEGSLAYHGGYSTFERRERCTVGGVPQYWSAGSWHHGGYFTLTATASGGWRWVGPTRQHWAFYHQDTCELVVRPPTSIPTSAPPTAVPPGWVPTATPPGWNPPPSPTPTDEPFPTPETPPTMIPPPPTPVPQCYADQGIATGMGIRAVQGATTVNYQTVGYYTPESYPVMGLYQAPPGVSYLPPWPSGRAAAPVVAGQPIDVSFVLSSASMNNPQENPLQPFTQWGEAKTELYIRDLGPDAASGGDDRTLFHLDSNGTNPTNGSVQNGNTIVSVTRWDLASGVDVLGPQTFHTYDWGAARWFEQLHSTDPFRGDYADPNDAHWPRTTPDIANQRTYLRSPSTLGLRFTPQPGHTYEVLSRVEKKSCGVHHSNYRMMRLTTVEPLDVGISLETTRVTTPGSDITYYLRYRNTKADTSKPFRITYTVPQGVTVQGTSRGTAPGSSSAQLIWDLPALAGLNNPGNLPSQGEIAVTLRVNQDAPERLLSVATIAMEGDSNPTNNRAEGETRVVSLPAPQATFRIRIHSELDPQRGVYTSSGTQIKWPANEVLDFAPAITLHPAQQPADGAYQVTHRIVGWTLEQVGNTPIVRGPQCKPGRAPSGSDLDGADVGAMPGCLYAYIDAPTASDMREMAHSYWSETLPGAMRSDVYVWTPLPAGPTQLVLNYAVLSVARENGLDIDGDGSTSSIIVRKTTITRGAFHVTLLAPRSSR